MKLRHLLLSEIFDEGGKKGFINIKLEVNKANVIALKLYTRHNFDIVEELQNSYIMERFI